MQRSQVPYPDDGLSGRIDDAVRRSVHLAVARPHIQPAQRTALDLDYTAIDNAEAEVRAAIDTLTDPLPEPPTLRGRLGGMVISLLRKGFWWQTHLIRGVFETFERTKVEERRLLEQVGAYVVRLEQRLVPLEAALMERRTASIEFARDEDVRALEARTNALAKTVQDAAAQSAVANLEMLKDLETRLDRATAVSNEINKAREELRQIGEYGSRTRAQLALLERRVANLLKATRAGSAGGEPRQPAAPFGAGSETDLEYWEFEQAFRGTRDEIKERQRIYLPILEQAGAGSPDRPIVDLGCGRGEWLELLKEAKMDASGVDLNQEMLAECRRRDLRVEHSEAREFLRKLPSSSLGAVTAFQVVEHMPTEALIDLIDEAVRALEPGGVCILETPNPANLVVATQGFYLDPTHVRPIPSALLQYLMESRGLCDAYIEEVNPSPEWLGAREGDTLEARFNRLMFGPRDYAVIARKV